MQPQVIESGVQLFSRIKHSSTNSLTDINPKLFPQGSPCPNEIIEVAGDFHKDLLLDFIVRCTLPKELNESWRGSGVVFVNTTHHISIVKITTVIDNHLKHLKVQNRKPIIEKALSYITVLNCYGEEQVEMTLRNLEKIIQDRENVSLLVIDDITSQFWIMKQRIPKLSLDQYSKQTLQLLQGVVKNLNILVVFSRYQSENLKTTVDLQLDYKIIGEKIDSIKGHFIVFDYVRKTSLRVPFQIENFITFA